MRRMASGTTLRRAINDAVLVFLDAGPMAIGHSPSGVLCHRLVTWESPAGSPTRECIQMSFKALTQGVR